MRMTTELATLAEAEEDLDDEDEDDWDNEDEEGQRSSRDEDASSADICAFDVPHFRYIDDDDVEESREGKKERLGRTRYSSSADEDCCGSSSYRYVVVSGTPLKILEHLLSDLRLDDQRGAPESRESGEWRNTHKT